jgi:hypothetical protein
VTYTDNDWVLEYSEQQCGFHIQTVKQMVEKNLGHHLDGSHLDYVPLGIFPSAREANDFRRRIIDEIKVMPRTQDVQGARNEAH